jgi:hypothetical protein
MTSEILGNSKKKLIYTREKFPKISHFLIIKIVGRKLCVFLKKN